jgi:hypothetical protein
MLSLSVKKVLVAEVILQVKKFNKLRLAVGKKVTRPVSELIEN